MSSASGAASQPATLQPTPPSPAVVPPAVKPPSGSRIPYILIGILAVAGLGYGLWRYQAAGQAARSKAAAGSAIRTATVARGDIVQTLRLTGTTGAEKFASLLVPQLRGSRSDTLRTGKTFDSPGANYQIQSNSGTQPSSSASTSGTTGGSAGSSTGSSTGGSSTDGQIASTMGQSSSGASSALQSATSRVGKNSRTTLGSMQAPEASTDINNVGSTTSQLAGTGTGSPGGGGGGGQSDYMLVLQRAAKPGAVVRKGSEVAEFDRVNALTRLDDYRAAVAQMDASFIKLKAEVEAQKRARKQTLDNAKAALDQAELDLKTIPVLGAIEAEGVRLAAEEAQAHYKELLAEQKFSDASYESQVRVADLELQQAHLELKRAERNADLLLMKAPIDGLVVMQTIFRGSEMAQIQAGDQLYSGMRFMQVVDPSKMVVNASVNQVDADLVRVGSKATVRFEAFPDLELPATVEAIGAMTRPGMMRAAYVKEIPVVLRIEKLDPRVIPDLSVSVDVEVASEKQVPVAPLASIFQDEARPQVSWVYVRKDDGWEKRQVETGRADNLSAAIRNGLQPGDVVAVEQPPETSSSGSAKDQS